MKLMIPKFKDIQSAANRIKGYAIRTPLLESELLNEKIGGRLLIKPESLQRTGSFKFRGAFNAISLLSNRDKEMGIVAYSSGNHAQAVAAVARIFNLSSTIIMPEDAPKTKLLNTKLYGAKVITYNRMNESRESIGEKIRIENKAALVKPYDDPFVIAGQGTIGLEISEQGRELGIEFDTILAPCGGGGLISGVSIAILNESPKSKIYCVEPQNFDDTKRSLSLKRRVTNSVEQNSICDSLLALKPGAITFEINRSALAGGLVVSDEETAEAVRQAFSYFKLILEPGGAVALAAVIAKKIDCRNKTTCVICSGGNIDPGFYLKLLERKKLT